MARMHPRRRLNEHLQRLDDLQAGLLRRTRQGTQAQQVAWQNLVMRLLRVRPKHLLRQRRELLQAARKRLRELARAQFKHCKNSLAATESRLRLLGPEQVLSRGYSITMDAASGKIIRRVKDAKRGQNLKTRVKEGEIFSKVERNG